MTRFVQFFNFLISVVLSSGSFANAAEGFSHDPLGLPVAVREGWDSTFLFMSDRTFATNQYLGTLFVVASSKGTFFAVTNAHVIKDSCPDRFCAPNAVVMQNFIWDTTGNQSDAKTSNVFGNIQVVHRSVELDLALLQIKMPKNRKSPIPVKISPSCRVSRGQKVYQAGFPYTQIRDHPDAKPIKDKDTFRKRWSSGYYLDEAREYNVDANKWLMLGRSTADSIIGMSGRPVFDENGYVIGVGVTGSIEQQGYAYYGLERPYLPYISWRSHSRHVPCSELKDYLAKNLPKL